MPVLSTTQMTLDFEAGLSEQHDTLKDFLRDEAIPNLWRERKIPKKYVAADMKLSPCELARKLADNPNDKRNFTIDDLEIYLGEFRDLSPVFYLLDKFGQDKNAEIDQLEARLAELRGKS